MVMKDGTVVPEPLVEALANEISMLKKFMGMSVFYQRQCVKRMTLSKEASMKKRVDAAMEEIRNYSESGEKPEPDEE